MIPASAVSSPTFVTRTRSEPCSFTVPPITSDFGPFPTGRDSPVIIASLTLDSPSATSPSAGTLAPGRTSTKSPFRRAATGTTSVRSSAMRSATSGMSLASSWSAPRAAPIARISIQWPKSITVTSVESSQ